mgnify:CR=1 FL=1
MTDNERHERLGVLRDRCCTCQHRITHEAPTRYGINAFCRPFGTFACFQNGTVWSDSCSIASVTDWAVAPGDWWEDFAQPQRCLRASETPCPGYERTDP